PPPAGHLLRVHAGLHAHQLAERVVLRRRVDLTGRGRRTATAVGARHTGRLGSVLALLEPVLRNLVAEHVHRVARQALLVPLGRARVGLTGRVGAVVEPQELVRHRQRVGDVAVVDVDTPRALVRAQLVGADPAELRLVLARLVLLLRGSDDHLVAQTGRVRALAERGVEFRQRLGHLTGHTRYLWRVLGQRRQRPLVDLVDRDDVVPVRR